MVVVTGSGTVHRANVGTKESGLPRQVNQGHLSIVPPAWCIRITTDCGRFEGLPHSHCLPNVRACHLPPLRSPQHQSPPSFRATRARLSCEVRHLTLVCLSILASFCRPVVERILNFTIITSFGAPANQAFSLRFVWLMVPAKFLWIFRNRRAAAGALHAGPGMLPSGVSANVSAF
jgi:hypothetical protein